MKVVAVPVKALERSKRRLTGLLDPMERATLALAMVEDVLEACLACPDWDTWVVSSDEAVLEVTARRGARPLVEEGRSLLQAVGQVEALLGARSDELAVVLGDLPLLTAGELEAALALPGPVVAAPARSDGGTNLLLRRPPSVILPRFGRASFAKHRWAARRARVGFQEATGPGLAFDLDRPEDVAALLASGHRCRSLTACLELDLAARLRMSAPA